jgi:hypothetical protein
MCGLFTLFVPDRIWPEAVTGISRVTVRCILLFRQRGLFSIERNAQPADLRTQRLEYRDGGMALPPIGADQDGSLRWEVAELDASTRKDGNRVLVIRVAGFRPQFDWLTLSAYRQFETTIRTAFVGVVDANDR